jgi:hypothetical protein|tara:strand:+ start:1207 stop:1377 length:171 start_codon:yes stop_codon:yes gene_type:complete
MDTTKWKSILVPRLIYDTVKREAQDNGRTIGGQLRMAVEYYTAAQKKTRLKKEAAL